MSRLWSTDGSSAFCLSILRPHPTVYDRSVMLLVLVSLGMQAQLQQLYACVKVCSVPFRVRKRGIHRVREHGIHQVREQKQTVQKSRMRTLHSRTLADHLEYANISRPFRVREELAKAAFADLSVQNSQMQRSRTIQSSQVFADRSEFVNAEFTQSLRKLCSQTFQFRICKSYVCGPFRVHERCIHSCVCIATTFTATYGKQLSGTSYCVNMSPGTRKTLSVMPS